MMIFKRMVFPAAFFFASFLVLGTGCSSQRVLLTGEDVVSLPGRNATVTAKLQQRNIFLKDIENQPIDFRLVSAPKKVRLCVVKNGVTDHDGKAEARVSLPEPGLYQVGIRYPGDAQHRPKENIVTLLVIDSKQPVIVLDIDNTLTNKNWFKSKMEPEPYDDDAVRVVNKLSERYAIVYLSARLFPLHNGTRKWLLKYGFPDGPIILWYPTFLDLFRPSLYKRQALAALRNTGANLAVGIGNTKDDLEAYREAKMDAIILRKRIDGPNSVTRWSEIETLLLKDGY